MNKNNQLQFKSIRYQQGWTMWSLMFTLAVIGLFVYIAMQLVPVYTNNSSITSAMNQVVDEMDLNTATRRNVVNDMKNRLYIDGNHELLDYKKNLKVRRSKSNFILSTTYDREIPLFFNVHMLVKFDNVVERDLSR